LKKTICYYDTENEQLSIIKQPSEIKQMKIYWKSRDQKKGYRESSRKRL